MDQKTAGFTLPQKLNHYLFLTPAHFALRRSVAKQAAATTRESNPAITESPTGVLSLIYFSRD